MLSLLQDAIAESVRSRNGEIIDRLLRRNKRQHPERSTYAYACPYMSYRWDEYCLEVELEKALKRIPGVEYYRIERQVNEHKAKFNPDIKPCGRCTLCEECFGPFVRVANLIVESHDFDLSWLKKVEKDKRWKGTPWEPTLSKFGWKRVPIPPEETPAVMYPYHNP